MKLNVIEIQVKNWDRMVSWYHEVLGLKMLVKEQNHKFALLGDKNGTMVGLLKGKVATRANERIVLNWRVENIKQSIAELSRRGVKFPKGIENRHWGHKADFNDPEGNKHFLYQEKISF